MYFLLSAELTGIHTWGLNPGPHELYLWNPRLVALLFPRVEEDADCANLVGVFICLQTYLRWFTFLTYGLLC